MKLTGKCKAERIGCRGITKSGRELSWGVRNLKGIMDSCHDEILGEDYYELTTNDGSVYRFSQDEIYHNVRYQKIKFAA